MIHDETTVLEPIKTSDEGIMAAIKHAVLAMDNIGYSGVVQLAGFIISGDPIYITAKEGCRGELGKIDRFALLEHVLKQYMSTVNKENT